MRYITPVVLLVQAGRPARDLSAQLLVASAPSAASLSSSSSTRGEHPVRVDRRRVHRGDRERVGVAGVERPHQARARGDVGDQRRRRAPAAAAAGRPRRRRAPSRAARGRGSRRGRRPGRAAGSRRRARAAGRARRAPPARRSAPGGGSANDGAVGRRAGRDVAEVLLDQPQRLVDVEVAGDREPARCPARSRCRRTPRRRRGRPAPARRSRRSRCARWGTCRRGPAAAGSTGTRRRAG